MDANFFKPVSGEGARFAIVVSRFNETVTEGLREAAQKVLTNAGVRVSDIVKVNVPGVLEIPYVVSELSQKAFDGIIVLGAVIEGSTPHFDYISRAVTESCVNLSVTTKTPISQGSVTFQTMEQALERSGDGPLNRGREAALVALEMFQLKREKFL